MKVELTYFRPSGKFYSLYDYETKQTKLHEIWDEVEDMKIAKDLPGLMSGHGDYVIYISVPLHPHNHPHLLL